MESEIPDHVDGIKKVLAALVDPNHGVIKSMDEIDAVGHRVVHGGEVFSESVLVTEENLKQIEALSDMAPLHQPPNVAGIRACQKLMPNTPQVAVFDTAFHQTMLLWPSCTALNMKNTKSTESVNTASWYEPSLCSCLCR